MRFLKMIQPSTISIASIFRLQFSWWAELLRLTQSSKIPTKTSVQRVTMPRLNVNSPALRMAYKQLGITSLATPRLKHYRNMDSISEFVTCSSGTTKQSKDSDAEEYPRYDHLFEATSNRFQDLKSKPPSNWSRFRYGACDGNVNEPSTHPIAYQDIRTHGPLFALSRRELDRDHEVAKQQWHSLCVEFNEKQRAAMTLWGEHETLKKRYKGAESCCAELREKVDHLTGVQAQLKAENEVLLRDIKQALELAEFFDKADKMRYTD
ncbi:hypothetical protein F5B22DRAFT_114004 [Xylaria bambusicola]|uniref:uncharacterized protein n=1 Tax=Xylaria bambusicola TaxID=326684 RepID=UPI002007652F|nr:uncharacterized protein F5B22DRAFT_114004 [Xylaria bambusicola]KAI0517669.1 hypothetical protein F5B22DRAFT_114004 [Xylaria bambusicola]